MEQSQKEVEAETVDSPARPEKKTADYVVDVLMSNDKHKMSENLQKSHHTKKLVEDIVVILSMSQPVMKNEGISEEEPMECQPRMMTMAEKLSRAVNNLGDEIKKEDSLKIPVIDIVVTDTGGT